MTNSEQPLANILAGRVTISARRSNDDPELWDVWDDGRDYDDISGLPESDAAGEVAERADHYRTAGAHVDFDAPREVMVEVSK